MNTEQKQLTALSWSGLGKLAIFILRVIGAVYLVKWFITGEQP